jgi:hypothetical protein
MRTKIYISGPITKGDRNENFSQAAKAQIELMLAGYTTYNPMLSMANLLAKNATGKRGCNAMRHRLP